jgi:uncharacterized Rmd1/YagE family protein
MKTIVYKCYKLSSKLSLNKIASFFEIRPQISWGDFITLNEAHISTVLKERSISKQVYIFNFGCITFVNFDSDEITNINEAIESITGSIDFRLFTKFHDTHIIKKLSSNHFKIWENKSEITSTEDEITPIIATILAKSVALDKIETDVNELLDESEGMIHKLNKGQLRVNAKKHIAGTLRTIKLEYEILNSIRIFDRSFKIDEKFKQREIFDDLAAHYELHHRFSVLEKKIDEVRNITKVYSTLSRSNMEKRLMLFEILLLALFPISHIAHIFWGTLDLSNLLEQILK